VLMACDMKLDLPVSFAFRPPLRFVISLGGLRPVVDPHSDRPWDRAGKTMGFLTVGLGNRLLGDWRIL